MLVITCMLSYCWSPRLGYPGLLLFSNDGQLTQHLLHPKRAIERVYCNRRGLSSVELLKLWRGSFRYVGLAKATVLDITENQVRLTVTRR